MLAYEFDVFNCLIYNVLIDSFLDYSLMEPAEW